MSRSRGIRSSSARRFHHNVVVELEAYDVPILIPVEDMVFPQLTICFQLAEDFSVDPSKPCQ